MSFERFLKQRQIPKVVDPDSGDSPTGAALPNSQQPQITTTPSYVLVNDALSLAANASTNTSNIIQGLTAAAQNTPAAGYANLLQSNYWDPMTLMTDSGSQPTPGNYSDILSAQQTAYHESTDPRTSLLGSLYQILTEIQSITYVINTVWRSIMNVNRLFSVVNESQNAKLALAKEKQNLAQLNWESARINNLTNSVLPPTFYSGTAQSVFTMAWQETNNETYGPLANTLNMSLLSLYDQTITNYSNFSDSQHIIDNYIGNPLIFTQQKVIQTVPYATLTGIKDPVLQFTNGLNDQVYQTNDLYLDELRQQIEASLFLNIQRVEDDLNNKQNLDVYFAREQQAQNVLKNDLTKQFIVALTGAGAIIGNMPITQSNIQEIIGNINQLPTTLPATVNNTISGGTFPSAAKQIGLGTYF